MPNSENKIVMFSFHIIIYLDTETSQEIEINS